MLPKTAFYNKYKIQLQSLTLTFLIGLIMHQYVMSNKFFNYFEMGNIMSDMSYKQGDTLQLGRWFLPVATNLFTGYSIPSVNGILLIGYLSLSVLLICELFNIQGLFSRVMIGALFLSFPGMASSFAFGVNSDAIGLGILLAALAVYLEEKIKYGMLPGIVLIGLSIGIYQPFAAVSVAVVYGILFIHVQKDGFQTADFIRKGIKKAALLILGFLFYYVMLQIILHAAGSGLSSYHGVDEMVSFTPKGIAKGLVYSYIYFFRYFFSGSYTDSLLRLTGNVAAAVIFCIFVTINAIRLWKDSRKGQLVWFLLLIALLPPGVNATPFLMADRVGAGVDIYMMFSLMVLWALFFMLFEDWQRQEMADTKGHRLLYWCSVGASVFVIWNGYILCNQAYHRMEAMTETTTALIGRMTARIEMLSQWESGMPVYFVNPRPLVNENYRVEVKDYDALKGLVGTEIVPWYNERAIARYMNVYLRFPVTLATEEQKEALDALPEIEQMPSYPAEGSIRVIDGILVVKISNGVEEDE